MRVVIVGGGKSGTFLAERLFRRHQVTLVEQRPDRAEQISAFLPDVDVVQGDGCEPEVLDRAKVGDADVLAAATGDDEDNLVVCTLAKRHYETPLVFARVNHPDNEWLFTADWGVDVAVSSASIMAALVEKETDIGDIITLLRLQAEGLVFDEVTLDEGSPAVGSSLAELDMPPTAQVVAVVPKGAERASVAAGATVLGAGDRLLIVAETDAAERLSSIFELPE